MPTPTLYKFIASELHQRTPSEMVDENGDLVFFDNEHQIMPKILKFDDDVYDIMNQLFYGLELEHPEYDYHFKKTFLFRFINRKINRQTIEAFQFELMNVFLTSEGYINRVYRDAEKFILQQSETEGTSKELSNEISKIVNEQLTEQLDKRETEDRNRTDYNDSNQSESDEISEGLNNQNTIQNEKRDSTDFSETHTSDESNNESTENNNQTSNEKTNTNSENDTASGRSTLPQNTVDLSLENRTMRTADEFEKNMNKNTDDRVSNSTVEGASDSNSKTSSSGDSETESTGHVTGETISNTSSDNTSNRNTKNKGQSNSETIGESEGIATGEASTDTKGKTDSERDATRDGRTSGMSIQYSLDELFKSGGLMEGIFNNFDRKCFLQTW